jgi:hypothetical protein
MLGRLRQRWNRSDKAAAANGTRVYLERRGADRVERIVQASIKPARWLMLLELAWTAGPVTVIAAVGAYYFGFGKALPEANLKFFIAYTVLTGVITLVARGVYLVVRGRRQTRAREDVLAVVDRLPDLIFAVRDVYLAGLDVETRQIEGARLMLRKVDLGPEWVGLAVSDLTGDVALGQVTEQIDIYRRAGMYSRIEDLREQHSDRIETAIARLSAQSEEIAELLSERCRGMSPNVKTGVPRSDHFIERILAAIEHDNDALMTLLDVEEILLLAFELLTGREIPMLSFEYQGDFQRQRATDQLESERGRYRMARARGSSRLLALATFLAENQYFESTISTAASNEAGMLERCRSAMNQMATELRRLSHTSAATDRRGALRRLRRDLNKARSLYDATYEAFIEVGRVHASFLHGIERWERMVNEGEKRTSLGTGRKRGLRISESRIRLDSSQQVRLATRLAEYFRERGFDLRGRQVVYTDRSGNARPFGRDEAKRLAVELAVLLDKRIHITHHDVQRAIDASNSIFMGGFEPGLSALTKLGWAETTVKSIKPDLSGAAERLAMALVNYYHIELDPQSISDLAEKYNANRERLQLLARLRESAETHSVSYLSSRPLSIPEPNQQWRRATQRAKTQLRSESKH